MKDQYLSYSGAPDYTILYAMSFGEYPQNGTKLVGSQVPFVWNIWPDKTNITGGRFVILSNTASTLTVTYKGHLELIFLERLMMSISAREMPPLGPPFNFGIAGNLARTKFGPLRKVNCTRQMIDQILM